MTTFSNLRELAAYVDKLTKQSIKNDVAPVVKERVQDNIEKMVYSYEPKMYERTSRLKEEIEIRDTVDGVAIVPTRTDDKTRKYIPEVVESGNNYDFTGYGYEYEKPRPFMKTTKNELEQSGLHSELLKKGLQSKGLNIK